ncbi:transporter substrate-binding domain-containing protein [Aestuariibacter halophilus]|uniref:Transporter substrate-binding domain-containing protein n=1 Tax=Fluctibacter halophilus TaxID=226011 RepID=A0ABS8GA75_9ALTE|nr:transporter substrate-binding domain-containing protein [Aestuariibacter halophilus]MCC2617442.1 transporter substrate-binding domain-containing protein [Aestuariibacter halophilus]
MFDGKACAVVSVVLMLLGAGQSAAQDDMPSMDDELNLTFVGEVTAPYFMLSAEQQPFGAAVELAEAITERTGISATYEHMPWARAYKEAASTPNMVLLTALRTPSRERDWQWLGQVHLARAFFIGLRKRDDIALSDFIDTQQFQVGTVRGYGSADYLLNHGFVEGENLTLVANSEQLWSMLFLKRLDLILTNYSSRHYELVQYGHDPMLVEGKLEVEALHLSLQMATGHLTSPALVETLRNAMADIERDGTLAHILKRWGLD